MKSRTLSVTSLLLASVVGSTAAAHSAFFLPNVFKTGDSGLITLDAAYGEYFFVPDGVFAGSVFEVRDPDGKSTKPDTVVELQTRTVVEHTLAQDGTYRFSTGWRQGNPVKTFELDGRTARLRSVDEPLPAGAKLAAYYQGRVMAETYATRGTPSVAGTGALLPRGDGLEMVPSSNPNELLVGKPLAMQVLVSSQALVGAEVDVYRATRQVENSTPDLKLTSDQKGMVTFTPARPGTYIFRVRHTAAAATTDAPEIRYTYTLVLEAIE